MFWEGNGTFWLFGGDGYGIGSDTDGKLYKKS